MQKRAFPEKLRYLYFPLPALLPVAGLVGDFWYMSDRPGYDHFHNCYEWGICRAGHGRMLVSGHEHIFGPGDLTVVPPMVPHQSQALPGEECLMNWLYLDVEALLGERRAPCDGDPEWLMPVSLPAGVARGGELHFLITMILKELLDMRRDSSLYLRGLARAAFVKIRRALPERPAPGPQTPVQLERLMPALNLMERRYASALSVQDMADACHISQAHFRRIFKEMMCYSTAAYLNRIRIRHAYRLLLQSADSQSDIAAQVGYADESTFYRNFCKITGMPPGVWRQERYDHAAEGLQRYFSYDELTSVREGQKKR